MKLGYTGTITSVNFFKTLLAFSCALQKGLMYYNYVISAAVCGNEL